MRNIKVGDEIQDKMFEDKMFIIVGDHIYMITDGKNVLLVKDVGNGNGVVMEIKKVKNEYELNDLVQNYLKYFVCVHAYVEKIMDNTFIIYAGSFHDRKFTGIMTKIQGNYLDEEYIYQGLKIPIDNGGIAITNEEKRAIFVSLVGDDFIKKVKDATSRVKEDLDKIALTKKEIEELFDAPRGNSDFLRYSDFGLQKDVIDRYTSFYPSFDKRESFIIDTEINKLTAKYLLLEEDDGELIELLENILDEDNPYVVTMDDVKSIFIENYIKPEFMDAYENLITEKGIYDENSYNSYFVLSHMLSKNKNVKKAFLKYLEVKPGDDAKKAFNALKEIVGG